MHSSATLTLSLGATETEQLSAIDRIPSNHLHLCQLVVYLHSNMREETVDTTKKFNTDLTDYAVTPQTNSAGPYANNLEVDALIVGAGFGKYGPRVVLQALETFRVDNSTTDN